MYVIVTLSGVLRHRPLLNVVVYTTSDLRLTHGGPMLLEHRRSSEELNTSLTMARKLGADLSIERVQPLLG